jgi:hypothetical protein
MRIKGILLSVAVALILFQSVLANDAKPATFADLAWLAGDWRSEMWGGVTAEHWSSPSGDSMMGMFSFVKAGQPVFYEFLTLERRAQGLVLHMRHFHPKLVAWEEKDAPLLYAVTKASTQEVVFERIDSAAVKVKMTYQLTAPARLTVILEKESDGKVSRDVFQFRRAGSQ